jgi:hypothetical protein
MTSTLPFKIDNIHSLKWEPGDDACVITYKDSVGGKKHICKVKLTETDLIYPNFNRFLACAVACWGTSDKRHRRSAIQLVKWVNTLRGLSNLRNTLNPPSDDGYVLIHNEVWQSSVARDFQMGLIKQTVDVLGPTPSVTMVQYCAVDTGQGMTMARTLSYKLLEANCPGFIAWCTILCSGRQVNHADAFKMLCQLSVLLPHQVLAQNLEHFSSQLKTCVSMAMAPDDMLSLLVSSVHNKESAKIELPELSMETTW